jgi:hypothetical protein
MIGAPMKSWYYGFTEMSIEIGGMIVSSPVFGSKDKHYWQDSRGATKKNESTIVE